MNNVSKRQSIRLKGGSEKSLMNWCLASISRAKFEESPRLASRKYGAVDVQFLDDCWPTFLL